MPHPPYYFDKKGRPVEIASLAVSDENKGGIQPYLDYIPYTNNRLKELITAIRHNTHDSAVIILMGDHGFRPDIPDEQHIHHFQNLNAVYFPNKDYANLPDSITGVNMFRVVFNKLFHQNFPLLKDSLIYLRDMK
jgi:phosphoglycerol transferase MdoB-like AlkP superfamily enzyme